MGDLEIAELMLFELFRRCPCTASSRVVIVGTVDVEVRRSYAQDSVPSRFHDTAAYSCRFCGKSASHGMRIFY